MEEQKITIGERIVNYKIVGQGQPVLVLHGWGKGSDAWLRFARFLASKGFQVIVPDLPGFGKSEAPASSWAVADYLKFVEDFVAAIDPGKFHLIGHSFGGGLAAVYTAHNPEMVQRLVLVDAAVIRKERLNLRQKVAKVMAAGKGVFMRLPFAGMMAPMAERLVYKIAGVHDYQKTSGVMRETFKNILSEDLGLSVGFLKLPVLVAWGADDKSTPFRDGRELKQRISGAMLEVIEHCGHNPHLTHPAELARMADSFFNPRV